MEFTESVDYPELMAGRQVLAIEDGPSVTHGGLAEAGAARVARMYGATLVDPRPYAVGTIAAAYAQYPHIGPVLPALGYSLPQREDLRRTIANVPCACVVLGTPVDLAQSMVIDRPVARVRIEARDTAAPGLAAIVLPRLTRH
jgi:predicted GTPase